MGIRWNRKVRDFPLFKTSKSPFGRLGRTWAMWGGIIVQGNKTLPQDLSSNNNATATSSNQGFVYLNNATIENAYEALRVWNYHDGWVSPTNANNQGGTGGIVRAVSTNFVNNRRSAEFMWYKSFMGTLGGSIVELPNKSYFRNCVFTTNDDHREQHPFSAHVTAWGVKDIRFEGCTFENATTISGQTNAAKLGTGIGTIDAGIIVDDLLNGYTQYGSNVVRNKFKNLEHGVYIMKEHGPYTTIVNHAKFENCIRGIRNEGVNLCRFTGNEFTMGGNPATIPPINGQIQFPTDEGIVLHQATGFVVEQNTFSNVSTPAHLTIGIRADGTGAADNRIYKNTLSGIHAGNVANRQNQLDDGINPATGLRYECNTHSGNELYDICVAGPSGTPLLGIRAEQGSLSLSAGNTFSHDNSIVPESDFYNSGVGINYFYLGSSGKPLFHSASVVPLSPVGIPNNTCPLNYTFPTESNPNAGGCITCLTYSGYSSAYSNHKAAQANYKLQYTALIDGGNTEARKTMVDTVSNAQRLKDSLALYAPNLSSTVLDKVARKGLLNDTAKYEAMKANAEGVNYEVYDYLENRLNLPQWMLDSISAARLNLTLRSYVLDTLLYHTEQREQANYAVLRLIQEDTAGFSITNYRSWLDSSDGIWARREKVNTYLHESKYDTALALAAHYDTTEIHSTADSIAFKNYRDYVTAYSSWMVSDSSVMRLDSTHLAEAQALAAIDEHKKGSNAARNLLNFFYDSTYFTPAYLPEQQYNKKGSDDLNAAEETETKTAKVQPTIKLYPNPANSTVTIEYSGLDENSKLYISDILGVLREVKLLLSKQGKEVINVVSYTNGVYMARVVTENDDILKSKFIVLK